MLKVKIFYHRQFNIDFGFFNFLHPFDGVKFRRVLRWQSGRQ